MNIQKYISKLENTKNVIELEQLLLDIAAQQRYKSCALLTAKSDVAGCNETVLGAISDEMMRWVCDSDVRQRIEFENAIAPILFHDKANEDTARGFLINTNTRGLGSVWVLVEYHHFLNSQTELLSWLALSRYIVQGFQKFSSPSGGKPLLTNREKECMKWVAEGKTSWEVSIILGVSERTVNFHIQNCMSKTNSVNRRQAVTKCLTNAFINLQH